MPARPVVWLLLCVITEGLFAYFPTQWAKTLGSSGKLAVPIVRASASKSRTFVKSRTSFGPSLRGETSFLFLESLKHRQLVFINVEMAKDDTRRFCPFLGRNDRGATVDVGWRRAE